MFDKIWNQGVLLIIFRSPPPLRLFIMLFMLSPIFSVSGGKGTNILLFLQIFSLKNEGETDPVITLKTPKCLEKYLKCHEKYLKCVLKCTERHPEVKTTSTFVKTASMFDKTATSFDKTVALL